MPPSKPIVAPASPRLDALQYKLLKEHLRLRIEDQWYDLTQWQYSHPGGAQILRHLHNSDATDAFYSLHSKQAIERLKNLPHASVTATDPAPEQLSVNFRKFRKQLEDEGWFERNWLWDSLYIGAIFFLMAMGTWISRSNPLLSILLLGVAMEQAGWSGHDYVHGRGKMAWFFGRFMGGINGFSSEWWSNKHNTHHIYPNYVGIDTDIQLDPVFYLEHPEAWGVQDSYLRRYQHIYFLPVCSVLYASWRIQSLQFAWERRNWMELGVMAVDYFYLFVILPWYVGLAAIFVGGFLVGVVVTATHQSEDFIHIDNKHRYNYIRDQFVSTRNAYSGNPLVNWLWGGMQYQLEHHLFPMMPKYRYRKVTRLVKQFAKENGLDYKTDGAWEILVRNLQTMKAQAEADRPIRELIGRDTKKQN